MESSINFDELMMCWWVAFHYKKEKENPLPMWSFARA